MRFFLTCLFSLSLLPLVAHSAPLVVYYENSGNLRIFNDGEWSGGTATNAIFNFKSEFNALRTPTNSLPSPITLDAIDIPSFLTLLNVPPGTYSLLGAVQLGTPAAHISVDFYPAFGIPKQPVDLVAFSLIDPEPSSLVIATLAFTGLVATARRCK